jgi:aspartate aminotransferase
MNVKEYRFYDTVSNGISMKDLLADLEVADEGSVILLHVCGNNPTGVDPEKEEWKQIADVMKRRNLFPFFDMAYQGFISGDIEEDSYPIYLFYELGFEMLIAVSFSKNMGLYGERAGPLHVIVNDPLTKENIKSQLAAIAESLYLTPVAHGSRIIKTVLKDERLREDWLKELKEIVGRLNYVRMRLYETLIKIKAPGGWEHIKNQHGMFTYTGLTVKQCEALIEKHKVFLVKSGRISLSGINDENVETIANAIKDVKENY